MQLAAAQNYVVMVVQQKTKCVVLYLKHSSILCIQFGFMLWHVGTYAVPYIQNARLLATAEFK